MLFLSTAAVLSLAACVSGVPLIKRIAQDTPASAALWESACNTAGGGLQCNPVAVKAFATLLAAAGPCDQQNSADSMIDLAKTLNNDPTMIRLAQVFAQQPRNTPSSLSVPYCQQAPKNSELNGLFQCQFQGANPTSFVGGVAVGQPGTLPLGHSTSLSPPGSCPAHTSGPIPDGSQLVDITQDPGVGSSSTPTPAVGGAKQAAGTPMTSAPASSTTPAAAPAATPSPASGTSSGGFQLQNGKDAQALNAKFATLTASSACTAGENACVNSNFAQCVNGAFVTTSCGAAPLTCAALPLVNKAGTSVTCTTTSDALARIAATGATGGLTG